ncbi:MAG: hypothetical protein ACR2GH_22250 [Pseudonocardia sp.]
MTETNGCRILLTKYHDFEVDDEEVAQLCLSQVNLDEVHFIGYYVSGTCRFHVDSLDSDHLNRLFRGVDRKIRRQEYERAGRKLHWVIDRLRIYTSQLDGGVLIRTVFDVEQGGMFYYWIDKNVYLVGISIIQSEVLSADRRLRNLANCIGHLPRGDTSEPFVDQEV